MKKKIFIICLLLLILLSPLIWYNLPYYIRVFYYRNKCEGVYSSFIEDTEFNIDQEGFSKIYDFDNKFVIPYVIEWHITDDNKMDIPKDVIASEYKTYSIKIKAEILINETIIYSKSTLTEIPISYIPKKNLRYFILLRCGYPLRCRFSNNAKLRLTVISIDSNLKGIKGKLVVKPETTL